MNDRPNLVIRASAGTGKTHRLTREYLGRLGPEMVPRLVMVTFTDNAAAELRMRISSELRRRLRESDVVLQDLVLTRERLPEARVSTLHTMCRNILAEHGPELGLGPDPAVLDDRQARDWLNTAILDAVVARLRAGDGDLAALLRQTRLVSRSPHGQDLIGAIRGGYLALRSRGIGLPDALILPGLDDADFQRLERCLEEAGHPDPAGVTTAFRDAADRDDDETGDRALDGARGDLGQARGRRKTEVFAARACIADLRLKLRRPLLEGLVRVVRDSDEHYRRRKRRAGRIDFDDMIQCVVDLLADPEAREELQGGMEEILVDEAQDLSRLQLQLLLRLWDPGRNRLVVCGDRKQSIYGWRHADPTVLDELEERIASSPAHATEPLRRSYRSSGGIVDFANAFTPLMLGDSYDPARDDLLAQQGAIDPALGPAVEWLDGETFGECDSTADAARAEGEAIARRILALVATGEGNDTPWRGPKRLVQRADDGSLGLAEPADPDLLAFEHIVVLYRQRTHQAALERAFRRHGVPYAVERGLGIAECREVSDLLNAMAAVVDPDDGPAVAGALRSPLFGVSDAGLLVLGDEGRLDRTMLEPGTPLPTGLTEGDAATIARALDCLQRWREQLFSVGCAALFERMIQETDVGAVLAALPQGEQRLANLRRTIELARDFDAGGSDGPGAFVRQLRESVGAETLEPQPQIVGGRRNVVRIMTIHQAKGLTFRVAAVPQFGIRTHGGGTSPVRLLDHPEGTTWSYNFRDRAGTRVGKDSAILRQAAEAENTRQDREEGRLLYVAVTRAQDLLVLSVPPPTRRKRANTAATALETVFTQQPDLVRRVAYADIPQAARPPAGMRWDTTPPDEPPSQADLSRVVTLAAAGPPRLEARGPWTVGVTSLLRLQRCVRWFWWADVVGIPAPDDLAQERVPEPEDDDETGTRPAAADIGTLGHAILETLPLDRPADWPLVMRRAVESELPPGGTRDTLLQTLLGLADNVLPRIAAGRADREVPFLYRVDRPAGSSTAEGAHIVVNGVIDLLLHDASPAERSDNETGDGGGANGYCEIVDYKFSSQDPSALLERYSAQLEIYALSVRRIGLAPRRATLVQAAHDICREIDVPLSTGILDTRRRALETWAERAHEVRHAHTPPACEDASGTPLAPQACREILHCPFATLCGR